MILISACLCGVNCKYNGKNNLNEKIESLLKKENVMVICPEQLGGLPTPRTPNEIWGGTGKEVLSGEAKVLNKDKADSTHCFIKGAEEVLKLAKMVNIEYIILKSKSPSCGKGIIYDGTFSGRKIQGNGVTAELLINNGFKVVTEIEYLNSL